MSAPKYATQLTSGPVYTPPNVAKHGCYVFDDNTGEAKHIAKCGYHSVFGQVLKKDEETPSCVSAAEAA